MSGTEKKQCDIVMKGGITSGIVYPPALIELSKTYQFRSIGGTSAGAIAAAGSAAAQYNSDNEKGFQYLNDHVQQWLGKDHNLENLFQARPQTQPLLDVLKTVLKARQPDKPESQGVATQSGSAGSTKPSPPDYLFLRLLRNVTPSSIINRFVFDAANMLVEDWTSSAKSSLPAYASFQSGERLGKQWGIIVGLTLAVLLALALLGLVSLFWSISMVWKIVVLAVALLIFGVVLGIAAGWLGTWLGRIAGTVTQLLDVLLLKVKENFYGVCIGHSAQPDNTNLTDWLTTTLDNMAGQDHTVPLTFEQVNTKGIELRMVTTNLSHGQPYIMPEKLQNFIFKKSEMAQLFPEHIVKHMVANQPDPNDADVTKRALIPHEKLPKLPDGDGYYFLPNADKLPIVVCTRMSLSFPILLSAVPLYTISTTAYVNYINSASEDKNRTSLEENGLQKNWFSDGGICSNFPIEFFDAWLPTRPTFGINLTKASAATSVLQGNSTTANQELVYLPNPQESQAPECKELDGLLAFATAIFGAAQNYRDNMQAKLPSYRERVVQIRLNDIEGGLDLTMPQEIIDNVVGKGKKAGEILCGFRLDQHSWVRFLVLMGQLEQNIMEIKEVIKSPDFEQQLNKILGVSKDPQSAYPYWGKKNQQWCDSTMRRIEALRTLINSWNIGPFDDKGKPCFFSDETLTPDSVLRVTTEV